MKYILKKEYPGSPKLGYIDDLNKSGHNNQGEYVQSMYDKNPEFWQPVVEKNYEILSVITNNNKFIEKVYNQDATIEPYWKIHSVKRLSDSEIFTIGDKINCNCLSKKEINNTFVSNFNIINNNIRVYDSFDEFHLLKDIQKVKQPLFTTEDGVDIFENNTSIYILDKFTIIHIKHKDFNVISKHVKYFSTKEKAEEYILLNKPCLSYDDVQEYLKVKDCNKVLYLVQSKIKQSV